MTKTPKAHCSFCGKSQDEVRKLIAGPGDVYICDECIALSNDILRETRIREAVREQVAIELKATIMRVDDKIQHIAKPK